MPEKDRLFLERVSEEDRLFEDGVEEDPATSFLAVYRLSMENLSGQVGRFSMQDRLGVGIGSLDGRKAQLPVLWSPQ